MAKFETGTLPHGNALVVDAMNLAFRWKHSGATGFQDEFVNTVRSLARSYECGQVLITADMKGSRYRKEIFPEYKANRKELVANQTQQEKEEVDQFFRDYELCIEACESHFTVFRYEGVEADDIAAYIVKNMSYYLIDSIWLISSDRDWDLLINENVSRFSTVTRKETTLDTWDYEVSPENYLSYKCLIGDKGDNIPGIPGVGPKRAAALIEQYGSAMDIADQVPLPGKYKYIQAVNENAEQIYTNYELMDLLTFCDEAIGHANVLDIGRKLLMNERRESGFRAK